ncbi:hypothetical protein CMI37_22160 [Candidatus Pacearchaeota archaeon]|nr:hypothetical protein [Candidatus Pacearchaeota archaeon]|tara:strand:- start:12842 stop:13081 length:240 start_codon:yes stop_codon:yes gene_type:complete
MGDSVMNKEFSDPEQRAAVCYDKWRKSKGTTEIDLFEEAKSYPGKNVKRRKDGVPKKKRKKRATKKGEYRDKGGNLKKK